MHPSRGTPLTSFSDADLDVLVVGAGITGACIALDASSRGLRTGLVDQADFGGGATANCLRIIHGGLRYLQHADLPRARASSIERAMWLRSAPHLVEPLPVVIPSLRNRFPPRWVLASALGVNEVVSAGLNRALPPDRRLPRPRILSRQECLTMVPLLDHPAVTGGVLFHDAVMYSPERLTLEVIQAARRNGVLTGNYLSFETARHAAGRPTNCRLRDVITGDVAHLHARWVINAAGARAGEVAGRIIGRKALAPLAYSIALNLVTGEPASGPAFTVSGGAPDPDRIGGSGSRQLLVLPWRGQRLYGTGHFPFRGDPTTATLPEEAVEGFVREFASATPGLPLALADVRAVQWGLLPVTGSADEAHVRLLKHHRIIDHAADGVPGALSVVSVKFTTARHVAAETVDRITGRRIARDGVPRLLLPGTPAGDVTSTIASARARFGTLLPDDVVEHLVRAYGARYEDVIAIAARVESGVDRVEAGAPVIRAQFLYAAIHELGRTADDLVWRRTELGARGLATDGARRHAARCLETAGQDGGGAITRVP